MVPLKDELQAVSSKGFVHGMAVHMASSQQYIMTWWIGIEIAICASFLQRDGVGSLILLVILHMKSRDGACQLFLPGRCYYSSIWSKRRSHIKPENCVVDPYPGSLPNTNCVLLTLSLFQEEKVERATCTIARNDR